MKTLVFTLLISSFIIAFSFGEARAIDEGDIVLALSFDEGQGKGQKATDAWRFAGLTG